MRWESTSQDPYSKHGTSWGAYPSASRAPSCQDCVGLMGDAGKRPSQIRVVKKPREVLKIYQTASFEIEVKYTTIARRSSSNSSSPASSLPWHNIAFFSTGRGLQSGWFHRESHLKHPGKSLCYLVRFRAHAWMPLW